MKKKTGGAKKAKPKIWQDVISTRSSQADFFVRRGYWDLVESIVKDNCRKHTREMLTGWLSSCGKVDTYEILDSEVRAVDTVNDREDVMLRGNRPPSQRDRCSSEIPVVFAERALVTAPRVLTCKSSTPSVVPSKSSS